MKAAPCSVHAQDAGAECVPFGVQTECALVGVDALRQRQEIEHVGPRQDQGHDVPFRDVVAYRPSNKAMPCASTW